METKRNLSELNDDDLIKIRNDFSTLSKFYLEAYREARKVSVPPPYFEQYLELADRRRKLMKIFEE